MLMPILLLLAAAPQSFDQCLKQSGDMLSQARCYVEERERLKAEQATLLHTLSARLKRPGPDATDYPAAAKALTRSQAAWSEYMAADCEIVDHVFGAGNAIGLAGETCAIDHYRSRNAVLRDLQTGYLSED